MTPRTQVIHTTVLPLFFLVVLKQPAPCAQACSGTPNLGTICAPDTVQTYVSPNGVSLNGTCLGATTGQVLTGIEVSIGAPFIAEELLIYSTNPPGIDSITGGNLSVHSIPGTGLFCGAALVCGTPRPNFPTLCAFSTAVTIGYGVTDTAASSISGGILVSHFFPAGATPVGAAISVASSTLPSPLILPAIYIETTAPSIDGIDGGGGFSFPLPMPTVDSSLAYIISSPGTGEFAGCVAFAATEAYQIQGGVTTIPLGGTYAGRMTTSCGVLVMLSGGGTMFIPLSASNGWTMFTQFGTGTPANPVGVVMSNALLFCKAIDARWPPASLGFCSQRPVPFCTAVPPPPPTGGVKPGC